MFLKSSTKVLQQQISKCGQNVRMISTTDKCFRGKINIQRPRAPHYDRALFNAVTQPILPRLSVVQECYQKRLRKSLVRKSEKPVNPYEVIIAKEVSDFIQRSKLMAIFHVNSIKSDDLFKVKVAFHKEDMQYKAYGMSIMKKAVKDNGYEAILPLLAAKNSIVFSEEAKISTLLKIVKKTPQLILIGAVVENRLLSKNEIIELSKLPNLTTARAQVVSVINGVGASLVGNLQAHQTNLCSLLDVHAIGNETTEDDGAKNSESVENT